MTAGLMIVVHRDREPTSPRTAESEALAQLVESPQDSTGDEAGEEGDDEPPHQDDEEQSHVPIPPLGTNSWRLSVVPFHLDLWMEVGGRHEATMSSNYVVTLSVRGTLNERP